MRAAHAAPSAEKRPARRIATPPAVTAEPDSEARGRLVAAMIAAIAEKGYGPVTIADIVKSARVSKRTFYEHFADKDECFLAAYGSASELTLRAIASAADPARPWDEQILAAAGAYVAMLEANPPLARAFMLEIHAAGEHALAKRAEVHRRFADTLRKLVDAGRASAPELRPLTPLLATAIVGGINEMALVALADGRPAKLREVARAAAELVRSVLQAPRER